MDVGGVAVVGVAAWVDEESGELDMLKSVAAWFEYLFSG